MSHFKLSKALPFPFYKNTKGLFWNNIRRYQLKSNYHQKWLRNVTTTLQVESSIFPLPLKVITPMGTVMKSIPWVVVFAATDYSYYELEFDISDLPEGVYFIYQQTNLLDINWEAYSEPIHSKDSWPNTILFEYWHDFNDYDIAWVTGIHLKFVCEAAILEPDPQRDRSSYVNQIKKVETLNAIVWDKFKLNVGEAGGVPYYVIRILNYVWACHHIYLTSEYYEEAGYWQSVEDSNWEVTRIKGFPKFGASIDVVPATNSMSTEFNDTDSGNKLAEGIVVAYNIETDWFGPKAIIPVIDIEQNG